jgi:hypothetical protein
MTKWLGIAAAAALGGMLVGGVPAEAATYTIYGSSEIGGIDSWSVFKAGNCSPDLARSVDKGGISGIDSLIVDISSRANQPLNAQWSASARVEPLIANLVVHFIDSRCQDIPAAFSTQSATPGPWSFQVPSGTKWMVITARNMANVSITF